MNDLFIPTFEMLKYPKSFPINLTRSFGEYQGPHPTRGNPIAGVLPSYWQPIAPTNPAPVSMIFDGRNSVRF